MGAGVLPLPTLIFNRSYVGMGVDTTEEGPRLATRKWLPFLPASASQESILLLPGFGVAQARPNGHTSNGERRGQPSRPRPRAPLGGAPTAPTTTA